MQGMLSLLQPLQAPGLQCVSTMYGSPIIRPDDWTKQGPRDLASEMCTASCVAPGAWLVGKAHRKGGHDEDVLRLHMGQQAVCPGRRPLRRDGAAAERHRRPAWGAEQHLGSRRSANGPLNEGPERHWGVAHDLWLPQTPHDLQQKT